MTSLAVFKEPSRNGHRRQRRPRRAPIRALLIALLTTIAILNLFEPKPASAAGQTVTVAIVDFTYSPKIVSVTPGTTVTWVNHDDDPHTVTATEKAFRSKPLDTDDTFTFTFTTPGDYVYFCSLHPHMTGRVVVAQTAG
jgi:plastocyanin